MTAAQTIGPVAPDAGFYLGVLVTIALVAAWGFYIERRFKKCKCDRPPTLLRPKWKQHNPKDDFDRYDKEDE